MAKTEYFSCYISSFFRNSVDEQTIICSIVGSFNGNLVATMKYYFHHYLITRISWLLLFFIIISEYSDYGFVLVKCQVLP